MGTSRPLAAAVAAITLMTPAMGVITQSALAADDTAQTQVAQSDLDAFNALGVKVDGKALTLTKDNVERSGHQYQYTGKIAPNAFVTIPQKAVDEGRGSVTLLHGSVQINASTSGTTAATLFLDSTHSPAHQRFSVGWKGADILLDDSKTPTVPAAKTGVGGVHILYGALGSAGDHSFQNMSWSNSKDKSAYSVELYDDSNGAAEVYILTAHAKDGLTDAEKDYIASVAGDYNKVFDTKYSPSSLLAVGERPDYGANRKGDTNGDGVFDANDLKGMRAVSDGRNVENFDPTVRYGSYLMSGDTVEFESVPGGWTIKHDDTSDGAQGFYAYSPEGIAVSHYAFHRKAVPSDRDKALIKAMGLTVDGKAFDPTDGLYRHYANSSGAGYVYIGGGIGPKASIMASGDRAVVNDLANGVVTVSNSDADTGYSVVVNLTLDKDDSAGTTDKPDSGTTDAPSTDKPGKDDATDAGTTNKPDTGDSDTPGKGDATDNDKPDTGDSDTTSKDDTGTDAFAGLTEGERAALAKLDYRDAGEDSGTAANIIKAGQTVYTGLKGGKDTVVTDRTDPDAINAEFTNHIRWYKGSVQSQAGGEFDTEVVEYTGRESGATVRYVFTTLDHDPFDTRDDTDAGASSGGTTANGTNASAPSDGREAASAPLASTGVGADSLMAAAAAAAIAAGVMGLGALERRRR